MEKSKWIDEKFITNIEEDYLNFFHHFVDFIRHSFPREGDHLSEKQQITFENQLAQSLLTLEKLHLSLYENLPLYRQYLFSQERVLPFTSHKAQSTYNLLKKLQQYIEEYDFIQEDKETICNSIISRIINFYPNQSSQIKIVIVSPLYHPWTPK